MRGLRRIVRQVIYLPLHPALLKAGVALAHGLGWPLRAERLVEGSPKTLRILVALPYNFLGDQVLSIPFLEEVHRQWPEAKIDVVVGHAMMQLFQPLPFIRNAIAYKPSNSKPPISRYRDAWRLFTLVRRGRLSGAYDIAIDSRWDSDGYSYISRLLVYLSAAKVRIGYSGRAAGNEPSVDLFLTEAPLGGAGEHELLRKFRLLQRAGLTQEMYSEQDVSQTSTCLLDLAKSNAEKARQVLTGSGIDPTKRYAVLSPGATNLRRVWPIERLAALAQALKEGHGFQLVVIGSPGDAHVAATLAGLMPDGAMSVAGATDIVGLVGLIAGASLFVGNDSGPAHVSGLLGVPTVVVSPVPLSFTGDHVNAPLRFRPCGPAVVVVQPERPLPPCHPTCGMNTSHCIDQIAPSDVLSACEQLLQAASTLPLRAHLL